MTWLIFLMGVANFALHRAVLEGRGPVFAELAAAMRRTGGRWGTYALEYVFLVAALWFARAGSATVLFIYGLYTAFNAGGYMLLRQMNRP